MKSRCCPFAPQAEPRTKIRQDWEDLQHKVRVVTASWTTACNQAWRLKINPGGEVLGLPIPEQKDENKALELLMYQNKLLQVEEMEKLGMMPERVDED